MDWRRALWGWVNAALDQLEEVNWPLALVAILAAMQFIYFDAALAIASLPQLIVFVLVGGAPAL